MTPEEERAAVVGERGYYLEWGKYYPARILATDIKQTFGRINWAVAVDRDGFESLTNLVRGWNPSTGGSWVSAADYAAKERRAIAEEAQALIDRLAHLSYGEPG